jgi:hypothetical protein
MSFYGNHLSCNIFFMACFSFLYTGITLFTIQQAVFLVCRRTDNYFVTLFIPVHVIFFATRIRDLITGIPASGYQVALPRMPRPRVGFVEG